MGRTLDRTVWIGAGFISALLIAFVVISYRNTYQLNEDAQWVAHTHEVVELTGDVSLDIVEAETRQRGFLITGDEKFLAPYRAAVARLHDDIEKVRAKTSDNARQLERIDRLATVVGQRVAFLEEGLQARRKSQEDARAFIESGKGQAEMVQVRELIREMETEESELLKVRQVASHTSYRVAVISAMLSGLVGLTMLVGFVWMIDRNLRARQAAAAAVHEEREWFRTTLGSIGDAVIATDVEGRVILLNSVAQSLTGWTQDQAMLQPLDKVFEIVNEHSRAPVENPALRALKEGRIVGLANHTVLIARDRREWCIEDSAAPIRDERGDTVGVVLVFRDVSESRKADDLLQERMRLLALAADIGTNLIRNGTLRQVLQSCAESLVKNLDVAFARIWVLDEANDVLELKASAGLYTHIDGQHGRVKVGQFKIGQIAELRKAHLTNTVIGDPRVPEQEWAIREGLVAFAGYPLVIEDRLVGVMALFARHPLTDVTLEAMGAVVNGIALGIEQKRGEQKLREQQEWLQTTLSSIGDAVIATDTEGRVTFLNPKAQTLTGWSQGEAQGNELASIFSIVNEQSRQPVESPVARVLRDGAVVGLANHTILLSKDGAETPIDDSAAPIRDEQGNLQGVVLVFRDITEKKRADLTLRENAEKLQLALDAGRLGELELDLVTEVLTCSERCKANFGFPADFDFTLDKLRNTIHPDDRERVDFAMRRSDRDEEFDLQFRTIRPDGNTHWLLMRGQMVAATGQSRRFIGVCLDITDQKRTEEAVQKQNERLRLLWETAGVILAIDQPDTMLRSLYSKIAAALELDLYFNFMVDEAGEALHLVSCHGISPETANAIATLQFGQAICGTVALERRQVVATSIQQSTDPKVQLVKGMGVRCYACNPLLHGDRLLGTLSFASRSRDRFDPDEIEFLETITHYVTFAYERLRLIEQLRRSDRRKDEFLATLAHELRNPMAPLRNGLQVMKQADENGSWERARAIMERQLGQMIRLVDDLLDISRITHNRLELRKSLVSLTAVIENAVETARPAIDASGHRLVVTLPDEPVYLDADLTRLSQVFWNLLSNSAKYTDPGGQIWLEAEVHGDEVAVTVRDTGIGIPREALPQLFGLFSQIDRSLERAQGGLGIGLALVKGLTEMHGGKVEARSDGFGKGSSFIVRLPIARARPLQEAPSESKSGLGEARRVLVVDDNRDGAASLAMLLSLLGNDTRTAHDGIEAIELAEAFRPDVVVLDIGLPKMNGYDVCRRIREHPWGDEMVVIAATGWGQDEHRRLSQEAGFNLHMVKPIDPIALLDALADAKKTAVNRGD